MTTPLLLTPLIPFIEATPALQEVLEADLSKCCKYLVKFASELSKGVNELNLLDICDERLKVLPEVISSIDNRPRRRNSDDKSHADYTTQTASRIRRIVREVYPLLHCRAPEDDPLTVSLDDAPDIIKEILPFLPREGWPGVSAEKRLAAELTKNGRIALKVLLNVAVRHEVQTVEELLVGRWAELRREWFTVADPRDALNCSYVLKHIRTKADHEPKRTLKALPIEQFPPTLREQVETYKALAPSGAASDPNLVRRAREKGVTLRSHEESTIELHCYGLGGLLARIEFTEDLEIADLILMEKETLIEDGEPVDKYFNPIIEPFRTKERALEYPGKRAGFDSVAFSKAVRGIMAVAAFNGVLRHHKTFAKTYRAQIDKEEQGKKKARKKEAFPMSWVDYNLARLKPVFDRAIKEGTFKTDRAVLERCLCYVYVMMLRYTGVRQQGVRICAVDHNVYFNENGSITFRWRENEIKNDKDFTKTIKRGRSDTFTPLLDVLRAYYKCIRPYLLEIARKQGVDVENQLFLRVHSENCVERFPEDTTEGARCFADVFKKFTLEFFDFTGVPPEMRGSFNAHHIRGIAGDWLHFDLGMSVEEVATFHGNTRQTTDQAYMNKKKIDCTAVHDEADESATRRKGGGDDPILAMKRMFEVELSSFRQELGALQTQHAAELKELMEKNSALQAQVAVMSSQRGQHGNP